MFLHLTPASHRLPPAHARLQEAPSTGNTERKGSIGVAVAGSAFGVDLVCESRPLLGTSAAACRRLCGRIFRLRSRGSGCRRCEGWCVTGRHCMIQGNFAHLKSRGDLRLLFLCHPRNINSGTGTGSNLEADAAGILVTAGLDQTLFGFLGAWMPPCRVMLTTATTPCLFARWIGTYLATPWDFRLSF
jgi:hypothetical protein